MSYSIASRYSKFFSLMGNPYTLVILDYLFENRKPTDIEEISKIIKTTKSKATQICEELVDLSILSRDYQGSDVYYEALDSRYANFIEKIIEYID